MKWFKHDTDASNDPKIRKLKKRFGMAGYGVYFNLLELIARKMEDDIESFGYLDDDWDDESLELEFGLDPNSVRTMFDYICEIGLFEKKDGKMYNEKIKERCDDYTSRLLRTSNSKPKKEELKPKKEESTNIVRTKSDKVLLEENRIEEIRIEKNKGESASALPTPSEISREFFESQERQEEFVQGLIPRGIHEAVARQEVRRFVSYWTEKNKSGTKQRWQLQTTFELTRRLAKWFDNAQKWQNNNQNNEPKGIRI